MLSTVYSTGLSGIDGYLVGVECDAQERMPQFEIIGLPGTAIKESHDRVTSALLNSGFDIPDYSITINLTPADRKKEGSSFDLAILISVMAASGQFPAAGKEAIKHSCFIGELSLSGQVRPVRGVLCMCLAAKEAGFSEIYVPEANAGEASVVEGVNIYGVPNVQSLIRHFKGDFPIKPSVFNHAAFESGILETDVDFSDVKGQEMVKRALEIAAAGGHNILLIGPPGTGKSMLAKCFPGILPEMTFDEAVETTKIHSVAGMLPEGVSLITKRPFRSPHPTMSAPSLVGGGTNPMPGEISLAHNGVLFLDELPEFNKNVTESLRQPIEDRKVTITRTSGKVTYPSAFMLVAAMNPCKCGHYGDPRGTCVCNKGDIKKYLSKISGPLIDRIDIQVEVAALSYEELSSKARGESSAAVRKRVNEARKFAANRLQEAMKSDSTLAKITRNADMTSRHLNRFCRLDKEAETLLKNAYEKLNLSARGYDRLLRVARTIADLDASESIKAAHIAEAIQLRSLERKYW